jgi:Domain of Unknown Function (DUF1206)
VRNARGGAENIVRSSSFEWLARAGFIARGLVYVIIGTLAWKLAIGSGGTAANQQGALQAIAHQPFGHALLVLVAIALAGYSLWRLFRAALGHGPEGSDSTVDRIAAFGSGIAYAGICTLAIEILLSSRSGSSTPHRTAAGLFGWTAGTWLVGAVGILLIGVGIYQAYRGVSRDFLEDSKADEMDPAVQTWFESIASFGHLARAVVFGLVGVFLVKAAVEFNPNNAVGLDGALAKLSHASYGPYMLGVVATGLVGFGIYSLADARYRRI